MAIFIISEGCTTTPMLSQRRAPLRISPNIATPISNATPAVYSGTAKRISVCCGRLAMIHITTNDSRMLRTWSSTRPGMSMAAEYRAISPVPSSRKTISASGLSKPVKSDLMTLNTRRLSMMCSSSAKVRGPPAPVWAQASDWA